MSLVGFKAENHPQQTGARGARDDVDDRGTHREYFDPWNERFGGFTLDAAAAPHNTKCEKFFTREDDGLKQSWVGERVWCNPPYSNLGSWVSKAWAEWSGTRGIVMLLPANRVEQKWWQTHVEPFRDKPGSPLKVEFLPGRMRFVRPNAVIGPKGDRPPFGCALLIWADPTVVEAPAATAPGEEDCECWLTDPKYHFTYGGATEPGSMWEFNPECRVHGVKETPTVGIKPPGIYVGQGGDPSFGMFRVRERDGVMLFSVPVEGQTWRVANRQSLDGLVKIAAPAAVKPKLRGRGNERF